MLFFFIVIQLAIHIPLLTLEPQGSLTLVIRYFRRSSVPSSTLLKSIWVNCILADGACEWQYCQPVHAAPLATRNADFHSTLAISASYVDFFRRKPGISSKILHHISQAYVLVNIKLLGPLSVSDSAIAALVSLAIYQQVHHQPATGLVHLHGLYRMIQLRGGIARLMQENRALALKLLR